MVGSFASGSGAYLKLMSAAIQVMEQTSKCLTDGSCTPKQLEETDLTAVDDTQYYRILANSMETLDLVLQKKSAFKSEVSASKVLNTINLKDPLVQDRAIKLLLNHFGKQWRDRLAGKLATVSSWTILPRHWQITTGPT